jgi:hypothetical protein
MKTQLTVDLKAVSHARFFYKNQLGLETAHKPIRDTVNGAVVPYKQYALPMLHEYPHETWLERFRRFKVIDRWRPVCILQLRNNHSLSFTGDKAKQMWASYNAHIHGKSKKGKK